MESSLSVAPFVTYALKALEHPPHMFVSKLAACCSMLFLTHSDPELLRLLCYKWAVRFLIDRPKLIHRIRHCAHCKGQFIEPCRKRNISSERGAFVSSDDGLPFEERNSPARNDFSPHHLVGSNDSSSASSFQDSLSQVKLCSQEEAAEYLPLILNSLVSAYFMWNWHCADYVIELNSEYEAYIRENILPVCLASSAEDGVDDEEQLSSWLLLPHAFDPNENIHKYFLNATSSRSSSIETQTPAPTNPASTKAGEKEYKDTKLRTPRCDDAPSEDKKNETVLGSKPDLVKAFSGSTNCFNDKADLPLPCALVEGGGSQGECMSSKESLDSSLMHRGTLDWLKKSPVVFLTLTNIKEVLELNQTGLIILFHAKYSAKSNEALDVLLQIAQRRQIDPMPVISVVYSVAEPELSNLYNLRWFPTIVYTPPKASSNRNLLHHNHIDYNEASCPVQASANRSTMLNKGTEALGRDTASHFVTGTVISCAKMHFPRFASAPASLYQATESQTHPTGAQRNLRRVCMHHIDGGKQVRLQAASLLEDGVHWSSAQAASTSAGEALTVMAILYGFGIEGDTSPHTQCHIHYNEGNSGVEGNDCARLMNSSPLSSCSQRDVQTEEIRALIETDAHITYPVNGVINLPVLMEWISSAGKNPPQLLNFQQAVSSVSELQANQKFARFRELHSAVVLLRRLQSGAVPLSGSESTLNHGKLAGTSSGARRKNSDSAMFIFLGGGMAAGKSTLAMALANSLWWQKHKNTSIWVNADEFKVADLFFEHDTDLHTFSTRTAESLLVQAINHGRSIVFDATMMWAPFVKEVIDMVRHAHTTLYKQGPGYRGDDYPEKYFIPSQKRVTPLPKPYAIHFLGVTIEPEVAVQRGFLRRFSTGRSVPISTQLNSFKLFSKNFFSYAALVDSATLYNNNVQVDSAKGGLPSILAVRDESTNGKIKVYDEAAYRAFLRQQYINVDADNVLELYSDDGP